MCLHLYLLAKERKKEEKGKKEKGKNVVGGTGWFLESAIPALKRRAKHNRDAKPISYYYETIFQF